MSADTDLLERAGAALYGERWVAPVARELAHPVSGLRQHERTLQKWRAGIYRTPTWALSQMADMLDVRQREQETVSAVLRAHIEQITR